MAHLRGVPDPERNLTSTYTGLHLVHLLGLRYVASMWMLLEAITSCAI